MFDYDKNEMKRRTYKSKMEEEKEQMEKDLKDLLILVKQETRKSYIEGYKEEISKLKGSIELRTKIIPLMTGDQEINIRNERIGE